MTAIDATMHHPAPSSRRTLIEPLENRCLMAASDFGAAGTEISFPQAAAAFPSATGAGQVVAVIDSGIDYTQPSLGDGYGPGHKVIGGHDFVDNDNNPMDTFGHGTEVAGIIAGSAATDGSSNYQGIAPDAKLVALRIDDTGDHPVPDSRIAAALQWVVDHRTQFGITVVNISYGAGEYNVPTVSTVYGDELAALRDAGVTVVASAGNEGVTSNQGINTPAADPSVISVGSVDANGKISTFSQRGPVLSILAPGEDVLTTELGPAYGYGFSEGTSFASPIVAGAVALMHNINPGLTPADTMSILRASGVATFDGGPRTGDFTRLIYPKLDLLNALKLTEARRPGSTTEQASVGKFGNQSSVAVDAEGVTHFVYYDVNAKTMRYASRDPNGEWSDPQTIDTALPYQGIYLSTAVDTLGQPAVAYFDGSNGDLKYAHYTGTAWAVESVDVKNSTGAYPSLVFDRNGLALVTYYTKTTGDLRAARRDFDGHWTVRSIARVGDVGRSTSAAKDASGHIGVAYEDSTHGWLDYAQLDPRTNAWSTTVVDKTTRGVAFTSLAFSTDNNAPWISYYDSFPANLKVARFTNRNWMPSTVATTGATGLFTTLFFDGSDDPNVVYYDKRQNALFRGTYDSGEWTLDQIETAGGRFAAGVVDRNNGIFRYGYYDGTGIHFDSLDI